MYSQVRGLASDLLIPKWFEKDPNKSADDDVQALLSSLVGAARAYLSGRDAATPFDAWWHAEQVAPASASGGLVRGFGIALIERALIDAACRAAGVSFFEALRGELLGFEPARIHDELAAWSLPASLPDHPLTDVAVRHTVGLADPLRCDEIEPGARVDDGLPQALEEDVRVYGLSHFKLKLSGDSAADAARLIQIGRVLNERVEVPLRVTGDANAPTWVKTVRAGSRERSGAAPCWRPLACW